MEKTNIIPIDDKLNLFAEYLANNDRAILSARFGDGKTFFLEELKKSLSKEYHFLTLYPVLYQVADNKDIFEYIKRDILIQLLMSGDIVLDDNKYSYIESIEGFLSTNFNKIINDAISVVAPLLTFVPKEMIDMLQKNISRFREYHSKIDKSKSDTIEDYINSFTNQTGGIYEFDPISRLIWDLLSDLKKQTNKKVVLVVEDLDRIDPGHIFRILNVLSAHMTYINGYDDGTKNKFNFDKVLLLCDYANIEKIYHHLYGEKTDFKGYISKFSAVRPFKYSIRDKIAKHIGCLIDEYVKDSVVSNVLAESIVENTRTTANVLLENIRNIKEQIRFASKQYKVTKLSVDVKKDHLAFPGLAEQANETLDKLYVDTNKPLMAFMSICKAFSLSGKNILDKVAKLPRQYYEVNHIVELCGILMIPLISGLQPVLDYDLKYRLGTSRGCELKLSDDGEILELIKEPYVHENVLEHISLDVLLGKISELEQYLY